MKVFTFKKIDKAKAPPMKEFSQERHPGARNPNEDFNTVVKEGEYVLRENEQVVVTNTVNAYPYGGDNIPLGTYDESELKWLHGPFTDPSDKNKVFEGMLLLGAVPRSRVPRHCFCGDAYAVVPAPPMSMPVWKGGKVSDLMADASTRAVSAMARALHQTDSVAVVRVSTKARAGPSPPSLLPPAPALPTPTPISNASAKACCESVLAPSSVCARKNEIADGGPSCVPPLRNPSLCCRSRRARWRLRCSALCSPTPTPGWGTISSS